MIGRVLALAGLVLAAAGALAQPAPPAAARHDLGRIAFDRYSLMIDGKRTIIWSGEFHPFRLPSPDLWRDILQKMKASGFNTVSIYFDWGYHSPKPGVYDFTGIRDMDRVLTMAAEEGLYVIARPGPYVNAELTRGGYPGWLVNQSGQARTDDPDYLAAADEWLTHIDAIIGRHQLGKGTGSVILYQIENELPRTTPAQQRYMDHLSAKVRADGITVPLFHNDQGRYGFWVPRGTAVPETVATDVDLYGFDSYPGGLCTVDGQRTFNSAAPDYGSYGPGGAKGGASASPTTPGFIPEYGVGWFDYWGSNGNYPCIALQRGSEYQRIFYGANLANGITLQNFYMAYGGTSWGWLPAPVVYTSYDYGAAIDEARGLRPKAQTLKQLGELIAAVPDLAKMERLDGAAIASSPAIQVYHNRNPDTDARFLLVAHKPSNALTDDSFTIDATLPDGRYRLPLRLNGFDAKWLVAGIALQRQRLVYSTSELQTSARLRGTDVALFHGRPGEPGETVLRYASAPRITVLAGTVRDSFDAARGDLKLEYVHGPLARVRIEGGGRPPLLLLVGDDAEGGRFWRREGALVRGGALLRAATMRGTTLALTGDSDATGDLETWSDATRLRWNGKPLVARRSASASLVAAVSLPRPIPFALPDLTAAAWRVSDASPEARPDYDDRAWQDAAGGERNVATIRPPAGQPNLAADPHGFHAGDVWYRGRFAGGDVRQVTIRYGAGAAGLLQLWLDGKPVGQDQIAAGLSDPVTTGVVRFALPAEARAAGEHVLALMIRNNGHNEDVHAAGDHKEPRGLIFASLDNGGRSFSVPVAWKIQGNRGGEDVADPVRGPANNGGLHGEREGWHLPAFDDRSWAAARVPDAAATFGTRWYRTRFDLAVPEGEDTTIGLAFGDPTTPRSPGRYRVLIFVNGWNMGQFIADVGPQRVFPLPEGILNHRGGNVLALAVTSDGAPGSGLEPVRLVTLRAVRGGVAVRPVSAPDRPQQLR